MGRRVGLWLVLPVIGLVLACAFAATAGAYTYVVRPNTTTAAGSWTVVPSGTIDSVLDDNVLSPAAPSTASDYVEENGNGPVTFEVGLSDVALRGGESVTSVKGWAYATTGDSRTLDTELRHGTTVLATGTWPSSVPASWQSLTYTGTLTQAEVDDLRQRRTLQGGGASTMTMVYASYAEVVTDMAAPAPSITSGPGVAGTTPNPSWSFSSTLAASLQCRLEDGGGGAVSDWTACTSPRSYDLSGPGDGTYTFKVRGLDDVGNAGPEATYSYTLDRVAPPAPTLDSWPPAESNNPLAMWTFTGEGGGTLESCRLERGATVVSDWALCTSPHSYNLGGEVDGAYTFRVKSTDMAGNPGAETTDGFTLDRSAPVAPTLTSEPPAMGNGTSPSWSFTHEAGASATCRLERGATVVSDWAACTSPRSYDISGEVDGTYTFRVRATDAATNTGAEATDTYVLDRTAPPAPAITGGPTGASTDATPQYTFTAEAGSSTQCRIDRPGFVVSDWASCNSPRSYNLNLQPDETYTFRVRATDAALNTGTEATRTYTLDRTAPAAPVVTGGPPASSNDPAPSFSFTHEIGATATCRMMRGATVVVDWAPCSSPHAYDLSAQVDGAYTFRVRATDAAGNTGTDATRNFTLDRVQPDAPTITGRPASLTNDATPTWSFTASFDVTKYRCRLERGATVISDYTVCTSPHTYDLTGEVDGTYTFKVRGSDDAANESTETNDTYTLDRIPPPAPAITGGPTGASQNAMPSYTFTAEASASTECRIERPGFVVSDWAPCASPRAYDLTLQTDATYTFSVRATDVAGNTGAAGTRVYTLDRAAPAAPVVTGGPPADSNDDTPVYSFTGEAGATFACRLERGATAISDWASCSTPVGYDISGEVDGSYTFRVRATDAAGNTGTDGTRTYALDRVAPAAPTLTGTPGADTNDATPTWAFTSAAGTTTECRLERGATVISAWSSCASPRTYNLIGEVDGSYTFRVRATDPAGNTGAETADTTALDRINPPAPTITGGPLADTADPTPAFTFTHEAGASASCRIERGATVVSDWAACSSPRSYDLTSEADGGYTFRVRATDPAGNTGADATRSFTLDRQAPNQPSITARPPASTNDDTPTWNWTGDADSTDNCRITRGATVVVDWTTCSPPRTFDLSAEPDGTYTFRVRSSDPAGNISTEANDTFALDRNAPSSPAITGGPTGDSADDTPTYAFTAEGGSTTTCRLVRGATVVSDWAACTSPHPYDISGEVDGGYTFRVRATDTAGNTGADATRDYTLDRTPPAAPTITSGPTGDSQDDTPTFGWTGEAGSTSECRVERGATVVDDWASCSSAHTPDLSGEVDGAYTFRVRSIDAAGNTGADSSRGYTLDRTPPAAPAIVSAPPADSPDDTPAFGFTAEAGSTTECRLERGATVVSAWSACASPRLYDVSGEVDGLYTFSVRATDAAGNTGPAGSASYTLDRDPPVAPTITGGPSGELQDAAPAYAFTAEAGAATTCRLERGATVVDDWAPCVSPRSYDLSLAPDGAYTFRVRATDAAGNTGTDATRSYTLDRTAPAAPTITAGPTGDEADDTPTYAWTGEIGSASSCRVERGATVVSDWAACSTPHTHDLSGEVDGLYTFRVRSTDAAGNTGADTTRDYTLDRTAPVAPTITAGPTGESSDDTPTFGWTAEAGASTECRVERGATVVSDWTSCAAPRTYDLSGEPDGGYDFRVRATDVAGNTGADASRSYTLDRVAPAAPTVTTQPAADSADDTPTWGWSADADAVTFRCRVERGATVVSDWAACTAPSTFDLTAEPDGAYTFRVRASDVSGNEGASGSDGYTLDRSNPVAPTITGGPTGDSADDSPTYTWTGEAGSTSECRIERGATVVSDWAACASPETFDVSAEPDGVHTFRVRVTDAAGNTGPGASRDYTLDRTAPAAPSIGSGPPADSTDDSPTYGFTAEAGASLECRLQRGGNVVSDWAACTSPRTYDVSAEPDGAYTFRVRATDAAGNTSADGTHTFTLDRTIPFSPAVDARPGDDGNDRTPEWTFSTIELNRTFECRLARGATVLSDWAACVSPRQFDLSLEVDGTYTFGVRAVNPAGTRSVPTTDVYDLDTAAPAAPAVSGGPAADSTDETPSWSVAAEPGAALECRLERGATVVSDWAACSTPHGFDLRGEPDGTYTFLTRATDAAGNTGAPGSASYNLDRTSPGGPVLGANPPAAGSDPTPAWEFTGEPGRTFECRVTRGATVVSDWAACTSPFTPDLTAEPDGTYTVEIRAVNPAGTRGPITSDDYDLDRGTPAAPVITSGPGADSPDDTPTWSFTGEPASTFECRVERGATVVADWAACTDPDTPNLNAEPDGAYTFRVRQVDPAGNTSPDASDTYNLDRTIPGTPSIDTRPVSPGLDQTPEWTVSGTAGQTFECRLTRGADVVSGWSACSSPVGFDLGAEPDATYTFHVRQFNAAGTRGTEATDDYVLDTSAPAAPAITGAPGAIGNSSDPAWSFTAEAGATVECRLERGAVDARPWAPCTSPRTFGLAGEPDGDYTFSVRATDAAGNTGPAASDDHRVDRVPPAPPGIGDNPGPLGRGRTPSWSFTAEDGATFECTLERAGAALDPWAVCVSPRAYDLDGQEDGPFAFAVRARDAAGNTSPATTSPYVLDTTPGAVTIEGGPGPLGRDRGPAWRFAGEEGASFECRLSLRDVAVADWGPCVSPHGFDLSGRPDGTFAFSLRATDPAGNVGPVGEAAYELDTTPPGEPQIERRPDSPGTDRTPSWRFTGEERATFACRVDREPSGTVLDWTLCASPFTADLAQQGDGEYRFLVRATDLAGNTGDSASGTYELTSPPEDDGKDGDEKGDTGDVPQDKPEPTTTAPRRERPTTQPAPAAAPEPKRKKERPQEPEEEEPRQDEPAPAAPKPPAAQEEDDGGNFATDAVKDAVKAIAEHPDKSVFPLSLLLLVLAFLAIQNRIDRSDPKLALAPTFADPDLEFRPSPGDKE